MGRTSRSARMPARSGTGRAMTTAAQRMRPGRGSSSGRPLTPQRPPGVRLPATRSAEYLVNALVEVGAARFRMATAAGTRSGNGGSPPQPRPHLAQAQRDERPGPGLAGAALGPPGQAGRRSTSSIWPSRPATRPGTRSAGSSSTPSTSSASAASGCRKICPWRTRALQRAVKLHRVSRGRRRSCCATCTRRCRPGASPARAVAKHHPCGAPSPALEFEAGGIRLALAVQGDEGGRGVGNHPAPRSARRNSGCTRQISSVFAARDGPLNAGERPGWTRAGLGLAGVRPTPASGSAGRRDGSRRCPCRGPGRGGAGVGSTRRGSHSTRDFRGGVGPHCPWAGARVEAERSFAEPPARSASRENLVATSTPSGQSSGRFLAGAGGRFRRRRTVRRTAACDNWVRPPHATRQTRRSGGVGGVRPGHDGPGLVGRAGDSFEVSGAVLGQVQFQASPPG